MKTRRLAPLMIAPIVLAMLAGCAASAPVESEPREFPQSLNEVKDASDAVVETMVKEFPEAALIAEKATVNRCSGEDPGIGRWVRAVSFTSDDIDGAVARLQDEYGDAVKSTGTTAQDVEYADGTIWPVTGAHTLIEDETGSYLLTYNPGDNGTIMFRVQTTCGVLR